MSNIYLTKADFRYEWTLVGVELPWPQTHSQRLNHFFEVIVVVTVSGRGSDNFFPKNDHFFQNPKTRKKNLENNP